MNPGLKYSLARVGLFLIVAVPLVFLAPQLSLLLKLMIAVLVSAALSYFLLRGWRDEMAEQIDASRRQRTEQKERLRAELAGEEGPASAGPAATGMGGAGTAGGAGDMPSPEA